jgi:excisionase family DNA binding protein
MEEKQNNHSPQWLSIVEYARTFGVSDMTVRRKIKTGKLEHEMRGNKYFIRVDEFKNSVATANQKIAKPVVADESIQSPIANDLNEIPDSRLVHKKQIAKDAVEQSSLESASIVSTLKAKVHKSEVSVEAENLLKLCNTIIADGKKRESFMQSKHSAEIQVFESKLRAKDTEIGSLKRQLEDMQLLIKMLEAKG